METKEHRRHQKEATLHPALHEPPPTVVPTKTTNTAAYVAVNTKVSTLVSRITKDKIRENNITDTDTVAKLFTCD
jgi:hypothetical protein